MKKQKKYMLRLDSKSRKGKHCSSHCRESTSLTVCTAVEWSGVGLGGVKWIELSHFTVFLL